MFLGIVIGLVLATIFWYLLGQLTIHKAYLKAYENWTKHTKDGRLVVSRFLTVEDVLHCMVKLVKEKKQWDNFTDYLPLPASDPKDAGHNE